MSDLPPAPPPSQPPPPFQPPPPSYPQALPGMPGAPMPAPIMPPSAMARPGIVWTRQFGGEAAIAILVGLATIIVPFAFNRVFFFLPIIGLLSGVQAIRRGRMIGGIVAIVLNLIGGIITIIAITGG
jgi:hypothetical protein